MQGGETFRYWIYQEGESNVESGAKEKKGKEGGKRGGDIMRC
jgi:hypothetical protein